jgi:hypothetical protein
MMSIFFLIGVALLFLKLLGVISVSWWIVIPLVCFPVALFFAIVMMAMAFWIAVAAAVAIVSGITFLMMFSKDIVKFITGK